LTTENEVSPGLGRAIPRGAPSEAVRPSASREGAIFFAVAATFVVLQVVMLRAGALVTRPFWLDEIHTVLVASAPSVRASIQSLAAGVDFNLPAAYLLYRGVGDIAGELSEVPLRLAAAVCVIGAVTAAYLLLRDRFSRSSAAAGALVVWSQSVVVNSAFEARFYAPWLLAIGCLLLAVRRAVQRPPTLLSSALLALASIITCLVHYFGVLAWLAAVGVAIAHGRRTLPDTARRLSPAVAGPVALAGCVPLYLHQRAVLSVPTWIPPVSVGGVLFLLAVLFLPPPTIAALVCWVVGSMRSPPKSATNRPAYAATTLGAWLLVGQSTVPIVLACVSLFGQPVTQPRYWVAGSLAAAPIVAAVVTRGGRVLGAVVVAVTLGWSWTSLRNERTAAERQAARVREDIAITTRLSESGELVVFRRRHSLYPVWRARPGLASKVALLDATAVYPDDRFLAVERDVARAHLKQFGFPHIMTTGELHDVASFYLIEFYAGRAPTRAEFPDHDIRPVAPRVFSISRR